LDLRGPTSKGGDERGREGEREGKKEGEGRREGKGLSPRKKFLAPPLKSTFFMFTVVAV